MEKLEEIYDNDNLWIMIILFFVMFHDWDIEKDQLKRYAELIGKKTIRTKR